MFLKGLWYFATPGRRLARGRTIAKTMVGEPVLLGRDHAGKAFAVRDLCPHRGMPLSAGKFDGRKLECCYHGWKFDLEGACTEIPCLSEKSSADLSKIRLHSYPCRELQGIVWVFIGRPEGELPPPPRIPGVGDRRARVGGTMTFPCHVDPAAIGLIDPAHVPFLHRSSIWRNPKNMVEKERRYVPSHLGFTLVRHKVPKVTWLLHMLGGDPEIEISFQLPGVHIESIEIKNHRAGFLLCVTPVTERETEFHYQAWWTMPGLAPIAPLLDAFMRRTFRQDRAALMDLDRASAFDPVQIFIDDPDQQAKWYYQLKKEFESSAREKRPFVNPMKERVLHWKS